MRYEGMLGVDAGSIQIVDKSFIDENGGEPNLRLVASLPLDGFGEYKVGVHVPDCWNGEFVKSARMTFKTGVCIIGDLCYCFENPDPWHSVLDKTDYFKKFEGMDVSTGGDGCFEIKVTFERMGDEVA